MFLTSRYFANLRGGIKFQKPTKGSLFFLFLIPVADCSPGSQTGEFRKFLGQVRPQHLQGFPQRTAGGSTISQAATALFGGLKHLLKENVSYWLPVLVS